MSAAMQSHMLQDGEQLDDVETVEDFDPIEKLQEVGIGAADIKKAKDGNFHTIQALLIYPKKQLLGVKGMSDTKADKMIEAARKLTQVGSWMTGADALIKREREIVKVSTGCTALNELLGGGFETKCITELYGEHRTGKTQLCMTLCVTSQLPLSMGGAEGKAAVIDTEGSFRPERVVQIAQRFNLEPEAVLNNIAVARAHNYEHQLELIGSIAGKMVEEPFKVLIVDSIIANFRSEFIGRGELADRQQKLNAMLAALRRLSEEYNVAVILTNQMQSDPAGGMTFVADPKKPVGGHIMAHASTHRLYLRKGKAEQRVVKVTDSPSLPEAEASFAISNDGVVDYKD